MLNVIDYRLLASDAIQDTIAYSIDNCKLKDSSGFWFKPMAKVQKEIFFYNLKIAFNRLNKFGRRNIIVFNCNPKNNWKTFESISLLYPYSLTDLGSEILIDSTQLDKLFRHGWKQICKICSEDSFFALNGDIFCYDDVRNILKDRIGNFISEYDNKFPLILEDNNLQQGQENKVCPEFLMQHIITKMDICSKGKLRFDLCGR